MTPLQMRTAALAARENIYGLLQDVCDPASALASSAPGSQDEIDALARIASCAEALTAAAANAHEAAQHGWSLDDQEGAQ